VGEVTVGSIGLSRIKRSKRIFGMNQKSEQQIDNAYNLFLKSTSRRRVDCACRAAKFALAELSILIQ